MILTITKQHLYVILDCIWIYKEHLTQIEKPYLFIKNVVSNYIRLTPIHRNIIHKIFFLWRNGHFELKDKHIHPNSNEFGLEIVILKPRYPQQSSYMFFADNGIYQIEQTTTKGVKYD